PVCPCTGRLRPSLVAVPAQPGRARPPPALLSQPGPPARLLRPLPRASLEPESDDRLSVRLCRRRRVRPLGATDLPWQDTRLIWSGRGRGRRRTRATSTQSWTVTRR